MFCLGFARERVNRHFVVSNVYLSYCLSGLLWSLELSIGDVLDRGGQMPGAKSPERAEMYGGAYYL